MEILEENITNIKTKIKKAAISVGRCPSDIHLIAVTKTVSPETIQRAVDCGITFLGENRVQEAGAKIDTIKGDVKWHLIGHLQRNKVKTAVNLFSMIQSVDSINLATEINKRAQEINKLMDILIQVNIGRENTKYGIFHEETLDFAKRISEYPNVKIKGLMAIAPYTNNQEESRVYFRKMHELFIKLKQMNLGNVDMKFLSMGMTGDFTVAIEEGANMIRVGTGIFGERKQK